MMHKITLSVKFGGKLGKNGYNTNKKNTLFDVYVWRYMHLDLIYNTHLYISKIITTFMIEEFFQLPPVSTTPVAHPLALSCKFLREFSTKFETALTLMVYSSN